MIWSRLSRFRALFAIALLVAVWILATAATGNAEQSALILAGAIGAASAFLIGFTKNAFGLKVDGRKMLYAAYIVAAVVALVALWLTGQLNADDPAKLAETIAAASALQQFTFHALKDSRLGEYLK